MKKILFALLLMSAASGLAQDKINPVIKKGARINYTLYTSGQTIPFIALVDSLGSEYVKIAWNIEGIGDGAWVMKKKSLENAYRGYWNQPIAGSNEELPDEMTVLILSKSQWNSLQQDKKFVYNDNTYTLKQGDQPGLKAGGKTYDALLVEGNGGATRLWILNNAVFPVLLKVEGNAHGVDLELNSID